MNHFLWTRGLIYLHSNVGYTDDGPAAQSKCFGCTGLSDFRPRRPCDRMLIDDRQERLTITTASIRRGFKLDNTVGYGRREHYVCPVALLNLRFHPTFLLIFHFFAHLTHQEDKCGTGKALYIMTAGGPVNSVALASMSVSSE
jgi:hypothetical protein